MRYACTVGVVTWLSLTGCAADGMDADAAAARLAAVPGRDVATTALGVPTSRHAFMLRESALERPLRALVRDSVEWRTLWREISGDATTADAELSVPPVDFARESLIVVALGPSSPMGDWTPAILGAKLRGDTLIVVSRAVRRDCTLNDSSDSPVAFARVPSHGGPVAIVEDTVDVC